MLHYFAWSIASLGPAAKLSMAGWMGWRWHGAESVLIPDRGGAGLPPRRLWCLGMVLATHPHASAPTPKTKTSIKIKQHARAAHRQSLPPHAPSLSAIDHRLIH